MVKLCSKTGFQYLGKQPYKHCNMQMVSSQCLTLESSFLVVSLKILHSALVYNQFSWIPVSEHWDDTLCLW
ncbi:MAG: hypothetical protein ACR5LA_08980 [Wolbachia sp.]